MSLLKVNEIQIFNGENVTITAPAVVTANDNTNAALRITQTGTGNALVVEDSSPDSTPFVVNSGGLVFAGNTASLATTINAANFGAIKLQVSGVDGNSSGLLQAAYSTANTLPVHAFARSRNTTIGAHTIVQSGDNLGVITAAGSDGTAFVEAARIATQVDGTPGTNDMPGRLVFSTTADGASTPTERMRITSAGNVGIGTSSPSQKLDVSGNINATGALTLGTALAIAQGGTGATDAATARTNLDVDQAGTDNSTDCTLITTSHDYLSIAGQAITLGPIDLAADVTGSLPYASISGTPTLGTAAAEDVGYFATAAQGTLADSAVQPGDDANTLGSGSATDGYVLTADGAGGAAWEAASGGGASLPIDLLSSGASIRKSDGTTAVLSESGGDVTLSAKNIVIASGGGIDFSANSNAAGMSSEVLSDYETGSWTPTVNGTGGTPSYSIQVGHYVKIGAQVYCEAYVVLSVSASASSGISISGLPFTSNSSSNRYRTGSIFPVQGFGGSWDMICLDLGPNTTNINLYKSSATTGNNFAAFIASDLGGTFNFRIAIAYTV